MLTFLLFGIKSVFWWIGNRIRKMKKAPDYVVFTLEGDYPALPQVGGNPILRRFRPQKVSLFELEDQIRTIAGDARVKGVVLHLRPLSMPLAKIDVLRGFIATLKTAGKRVVAWSYTYDTPMYYLASAADEILLLPGGMLAPLGLYRQYTYLADVLEKVGVMADIIQISPYKSAADTFTRKEMSEEVRLMGNWLADTTFDGIIHAIAEGRKVDVQTATALVNQTPCTDLQAVEMGAVDGLLGDDELPGFLGGVSEPVRLVPWEAASKRLLRRLLKKPGKYIALMQIEGMIVDGRSGQPPVEPPIPIPVVMDERAGDMSVVNTVRQIQEDKRVAGAVLYVDSGGGSATASETMRIALEKLAAVKPLVVVMGPVAASGGYWVSTPGKIILAQPNTITGSIGVLSGKIADVGLLDKLFVHQEVISRGANVRIFEPEAPFSQAESARVWAYIQRVYDMFLERVADSREMDKQAVDAIGAGRVWTGRQGLENGLIDELGGLDLAFGKVRTLCGIDERADVRFFLPTKSYLPPVSDPASLLKYGLEGLKIMSGRAMCLCPWVERV
jgi:protease-4